LQVVEPNPDRREVDTLRLVSELSRMTAVQQVERVPDAEITALLKPWLGDAGADADLPVPVLIDVTLRSNDARQLDAVKAAAAAISPLVRVDQHAQWLAPLAALLSSLVWLSLLLVMLMAIAAAAAVVLTARAALNTHRATIEVLHLMGATDVQVARLFQRRIALDALFGGLLGLVLAGIVLLLVGGRLSAIGSDLLGSAQIGWLGWLVLLLMPLLGAGLATLSARFTVVRALRKML
jgi:cell division transport system permease protein